VIDAQPVDAGAQPAFALPLQPEDEAGERRPCPMCGEMIAAKAAKCRFCGEVFDPQLRRLEKKRARRSRGDADVDADLTGGDLAVAILCSGIGCILGLVWVSQGKPKGWKMVGVSLIAAFVIGIIRVLISVGGQGAGR
jgi:hypothetical protein